MKLTKLVHACLIVEKDSRRILVDPGNYSWQSGLVKPELLKGIDIVVVTHGHPDHLHEDFVRAIAENSPEANWYGPQQVVTALSTWKVVANTSSRDEAVRLIGSEHADLSPWSVQQPEHTSYVLFDELLIGGDCHTLSQNHGARIFAGAINGGPWGAVVGFLKMIETMTTRPKIVVPLHDWHFHDEARQSIYERLPEVIDQFGVQFVPLESGVATEL